MLTKDKEYDQNTQSIKTVIIEGETWYRITDLPEGEPIIETKPEQTFVEPTLEERVNAIENLELERVING